MSLGLYMDVHVPRPITVALRLREVDVLTSQEDGTARWNDPDLLDRATSLGRALFTRDDDLLREAARRQEQAEPFAGVIYAHQDRVTIGQCIADLELIALASEPEDTGGARGVPPTATVGRPVTVARFGERLQVGSTPGSSPVAGCRAVIQAPARMPGPESFCQ